MTGQEVVKLQSKDKGPDRRQMIVGVVLTKDGTPLAHHVFPGNTPDATAFSVVIEEMRNRFGIKRVILVGDRGMFNAKIVTRIEELGMEYIAGVRMRTVWDVRGATPPIMGIQNNVPEWTEREPPIGSHQRRFGGCPPPFKWNTSSRSPPELPRRLWVLILP